MSIFNIINKPDENIFLLQRIPTNRYKQNINYL
jgi:hypothetical protein